MRMDEIKEIAKRQDIKTGKMKKADLIKAIQVAEGNYPCFEVGKLEDCEQKECLWREDCN